MAIHRAAFNGNDTRNEKVARSLPGGRLITGIIFASTTQPIAVRRDPGVNGSKKLRQARDAIDPRNPLPRVEATGDFIQRIRPDIQTLIQFDETHSGVEIGIREGGETIFQAGRLSSCILEQRTVIPAPKPLDLAATERALAVVHNHGFSVGFSHASLSCIIEQRNGEGVGSQTRPGMIYVSESIYPACRYGRILRSGRAAR